MKRIPDCPGGMGNANDWIKAREALGFPQDRTVSYEYTTYSGASDTLELLQEAHRDAIKYGDEMYDIGYDGGFISGYKQALEDLKEVQISDRSPNTIKTILRKTKCPLSIQNRFYEISNVVHPNTNKSNKQKKNKKS